MNTHGRPASQAANAGAPSDQRSEIQTYFDAEATRYVHDRELQYSYISQKRLTLDLLPEQFDRVLDLGCGPALMANDLLDRAGEVWGVDVSERMISYGKARMRNHPLGDRCDLRVGNSEKLIFADNYFDALISLGMLEYLETYDRAIAEMYRVLRPGGVAVLTVPTRISAYYLARAPCDKARMLVKRLLGRTRAGAERFPTNRCVPWRLDGALRSAGFQKIAGRYCNFMFYPLHEMHAGVSLALNRKLAFLSRHAPGAFLGTQYVVKAMKPQQI